MLMMLEVADGDQTLRTVFGFTLYSAQSHRRLERKSRGGQQTVRQSDSGSTRNMLKWMVSGRTHTNHYTKVEDDSEAQHCVEKGLDIYTITRYTVDTKHWQGGGV